MSFGCPTRGAFGRWCSNLSEVAGTRISTICSAVSETIATAYNYVTAKENRTPIITAAASISLAVTAGSTAGLILPNSVLAESLSGAAFGFAANFALGNLSSKRMGMRTLATNSVSALATGAVTLSLHGNPVLALSFTALSVNALEGLFWTRNNKNPHWSQKKLLASLDYETQAILTKTFLTAAAFIIAFYQSLDLIPAVRTFWGINSGLSLFVLAMGLTKFLCDCAWGRDSHSSRRLNFADAKIPDMLMLFGTIFGGAISVATLLDWDKSKILIPTLVIASLATLSRLFFPGEPFLALLRYADLLDKAKSIPEPRTRTEERAILHPPQSIRPNPGCTLNFILDLAKRTTPRATEVISEVFNPVQGITLAVSMFYATFIPTTSDNAANSAAAQNATYILLTLGIISAIYKGLRLDHFLGSKKNPCIAYPHLALRFFLKFMLEPANQLGNIYLGISALLAAPYPLITGEALGSAIARGVRVVNPTAGGVGVAIALMTAIKLARMDFAVRKYGADADEITDLKAAKGVATAVGQYAHLSVRSAALSVRRSRTGTSDVVAIEMKMLPGKDDPRQARVFSMLSSKAASPASGVVFTANPIGSSRNISGTNMGAGLGP